MTLFFRSCLLPLLATLPLVAGCRHSLNIVRSPVPPIHEGGWLQVGGNTVRGSEYIISIPASRLAAAPAWMMKGSDNPPLLPGVAVSLARRALASEFQDSRLWTVDSISITLDPGITQGAANPISNRGYYDIEFRAPESPFGADHYSIWVLMDGTVILPRVWRPYGVEVHTPPNATSPHP